MQSNVSRNNHVDNIVCTQFFSWSAVIIGALVAVGLGFLLKLFSKGIGLTLYTTDVDGATVLVVGGFIALIVGSIATMFTAGFAAGFFAGPNCAKRNFGVVYGFVAWCLALLLMSFLTSNMMELKQGYHAPQASSYVAANEAANTTQKVTNRLHPSTDLLDTPAEKQIRAMGMASLSMFILFFIGALAASFGGYIGFYYWDKWNDAYRNR